MTKTRDLANLVSGSNPLVDGVIDYSEITNTPAPFDPATLATVAVSGSFTDLSNQPTPFDPATLASVATTGAYADVTGTPTLAAVATNGAYSSLSGTPTLAAVATSGAYSSLSGTPAAALPLTGGTLSGTLSTPALNIGGTQVISSARALTNVASIDATTAASFAAGGVGGSTTLLHDVDLTVDVTNINISMPSGYKKFIVAFRSLAATTIGSQTLNARLLDTSLNVVTATNYVYMGRDNGTNVDSGGSLQSSWPIGGAICPPTDPVGSNAAWSFEFYNIRGVSKPSFTQIGFSQSPGAFGGHITRSGGAYNVKADFGGVRFYLSNYNFLANESSYTVWGVK